MSTVLHIPRIETYEYMGIMFRLGITDNCVHWNVRFEDRMCSGRTMTMNAAKSRAKQEVQRAIERHERRLGRSATS